MPPDVADTVAGPPLNWAACITAPCLLRLCVSVKPDSSAVPVRLRALRETWVVLAARARPVRVEGCAPPYFLRIGEVRVLERGSDKRRTSVPQKPLQGLDWRRNFTIECAGVGQTWWKVLETEEVSGSPAVMSTQIGHGRTSCCSGASSIRTMRAALEQHGISPARSNCSKFATMRSFGSGNKGLR